MQVIMSESDLDCFHDLGRQNGFRYWFARDLMKMLGYRDYAVFKRGPINKAMLVCSTLDRDVSTNFEKETRLIEGIKQPDYRLSKFACYLIAINGDVKKKEVAAAQVYFVAVNQISECMSFPDDRSPLERMCKEELAANLFIITQTEAKIRNENIQGQKNLKDAALFAREQVRRAMEAIAPFSSARVPQK